MLKNLNCITTIIIVEGIEKIKTEKKMTTKKSEEYFFHQSCNKRAANAVKDSRFWLAA